MQFTDPDELPAPERLQQIEAELGLEFPLALRTLFLEHNGGEPDPYVLNFEAFETTVQTTLPIITQDEDADTAVEVYEDLVLERGMIPRNFFPFACDSGGDYFFVDCNTVTAAVYCYISDSYFYEDAPLQKIAESLEEFWNMLEPES